MALGQTETKNVVGEGGLQKRRVTFSPPPPALLGYNWHIIRITLFKGEGRNKCGAFMKS